MSGQKMQLEKLEIEAKALSSSRVIKTEGEQALLLAHLRLIETLLYGAPKTKTPARHHE